MKRFLPLLLLSSFVGAFAQDATPAADPRLASLKDLDGYFPFAVPATREAWEKRADEVRKRVQISQGLFPLPTKTPLNAVVHGRIEQADYTVEKVFFEAMPGFFVTGNLYRPRGKAGPYPAVLCAHGHWEDARFAIRGDDEMKKELASGGERLPEAGRSIFQSLGVQLARMGCVAFVYDMLGNCDSQQISMALAHKFAKQRPDASSPDGWGFFSAQAELRLQSVMGLQTWSSIRAIDFVTSLPDVDPKRIGMTGASGGGTQTFIAAAIDPRISVACPAVMVSTAMQGGCTCENASLLRIGTGNVEIAALFAPKPLGLTAANDWTKEMETKGFPELQQLYALLGAPENVALWPMLQFGHNYNAPSRERIYAWFNKHFALGLPEPIAERDYPLLTREQLTVWTNDHPAPKEVGLELEKKLLRWWDDDSTKQLKEQSELLARGWRALLGGPIDPAGPITNRVDPAAGSTGVVYSTGRFHNEEHSLDVRYALLESKAPVRGCAVYLSADGIDSAVAEKRPPALEALLGKGLHVIAIDWNTHLPQQPLVKNPREALAYTLGYNDPIFTKRLREVLLAIHGARQHVTKGGKLFVVATRADLASLAAAASAMAGHAVDGLAIEAGDEHAFAKITNWRDPNLLPGAVKYGDLAALIKMIAPRPVLLFKNDSERTAAIEKLISGER